MPAGDCFPLRGDHVVLDFVGDGFPFPLAITDHQLQAALDDQDSVAADWRLQDDFECLIKLASRLAIADFLLDSPASKAAEGVVLGTIARWLSSAFEHRAGNRVIIDARDLRIYWMREVERDYAPSSPDRLEPSRGRPP